MNEHNVGPGVPDRTWTSCPERERRVASWREVRDEAFERRIFMFLTLGELLLLGELCWKLEDELR